MKLCHFYGTQNVPKKVSLKVPLNSSDVINTYEKILNEINDKIEKINNWNNSIIDADFREI